jgi:hypothetical protein
MLFMEARRVAPLADFTAPGRLGARHAIVITCSTPS